MKFITREDNPQVAELRRRLDAFYASTKDYDDFQEANFKPPFWDPIRDRAQQYINQHGSCRILEFGAGRTAFGQYLGDLRSKIVFHVQDVTPQNRDHLSTQADHVHIGDLAGLRENYDIIFSTFVWEHVSNPKQVLTHLTSLLKPGGRLIIACPRYDAPFYVPPSARHYSRPKQFILSLWLASQRLMTMLGGQSQFLIHTDPALFHQPWFRDSDAIHWVSRFDVRGSVPRSCTVRKIKIPVKGIKQWIWARVLLMFVEIRT